MVSIAITGDTGIGKTFTTVKWAYEQFDSSVFICRNLEELKNLKNERCIIFDDISFELSDPTLLIKLCDPDLHCSVRILKKIITIQPNIVKLFTHNETSAFQPLLATHQQQKAIDRRLTVCPVASRKQALTALSETLAKSITKEASTVRLQSLVPELQM